MQVGNKGQAVVLTVVAVGALGFLVSQFLPKGSTVAMIVQNAVATQKTLSGSGSLPENLSRDPFSHPKVASSANSEPAAEATVINSQPAPTPPDAATVDGNFGSLPPAGVAVSTLPDVGKKPVPDIKTAPTVAVAKTINVQVVGIISRPVPTALLTIDGNDRTVKIGDSLYESWKVADISNGAIVLRRDAMQNSGYSISIPLGKSRTL